MSDPIDTESTQYAPAPPPVPILTTEFARKVTFASHQNDVPVLLELWVENPSDTAMEDLRLGAQPRARCAGAQGGHRQHRSEDAREGWDRPLSQGARRYRGGRQQHAVPCVGHVALDADWYQ